MSHSQCPNIKTEILKLRSKIGELEGLKSVLLQYDPEFEERFERIKDDLRWLTAEIERKIENAANEIIIPRIIESGIYKGALKYSQGRLLVWTKAGEYFHINIKQNPVYEERYVFAGSYTNGSALVKTKEEIIYFIDLNGNKII
jgi:hypothetical protein